MEKCKKLYKNNKFKTSVPTWNEELNYLIAHILYQTRYSRLFWIYIKEACGKLINPSTRIYINKIENESRLKPTQDIIFIMITYDIISLSCHEQVCLTSMFVHVMSWTSMSFIMTW